MHELNILHDGIDLTGPLRLRLSAVPRFITRYHALREQVAQLTLATGPDNEPQTYEADPEQAHVEDGMFSSCSSWPCAQPVLFQVFQTYYETTLLKDESPSTMLVISSCLLILLFTDPP